MSNSSLADCSASTVFLPALAQQGPTPAPAPSPPAQRMETTTTVTATKAMAGQWRTSKLVGVDVYNNANEKIGDINEILLEPSGKVAGFVIGVGGFLGMGEHDVLVKPDQIKFVNEPIRTTSAGETSGRSPAGTTGTGAPPRTDRPARAADEKWYPDHGIMNVTKDQLKAMPAFKYN